jgi:hypothetical protein
MSFFGKLRLPDDRAYDRHAIDVLSCCHVAHITCYNYNNAVALVPNRCPACRDWIVGTKKLLFGLPTQYSLIRENGEDEERRSRSGKFGFLLSFFTSLTFIPSAFGYFFLNKANVWRGYAKFIIKY